jgi:hypothetical protein
MAQYDNHKEAAAILYVVFGASKHTNLKRQKTSEEEEVGVLT